MWKAQCIPGACTHALPQPGRTKRAFMIWLVIMMDAHRCTRTHVNTPTCWWSQYALLNTACTHKHTRTHAFAGQHDERRAWGLRRRHIMLGYSIRGRCAEDYRLLSRYLLPAFTHHTLHSTAQAVFITHFQNIRCVLQTFVYYFCYTTYLTKTLGRSNILQASSRHTREWAVGVHRGYSCSR